MCRLWIAAEQTQCSRCGHYPEIANPFDLLPTDLAQLVPADRHGWAVGQWLVGLEAKVMEDALAQLMGAGVVALPIHDALLCHEEDAQEACRSLVEAIHSRFGARSSHQDALQRVPGGSRGHIRRYDMTDHLALCVTTTADCLQRACRSPDEVGCQA